jgi:DNA-damage-inducible protein D
MGSTELAGNLFRTTQADDKLRQQDVWSKDRAGQIHKEVGRKLRQTSRERGGTMPENPPAVESIRMVENREKKRLRAERKRILPGPPPAG